MNTGTETQALLVKPEHREFQKCVTWRYSWCSSRCLSYMSWHLSCHNMKCHSWISLSCWDTWTLAHMFLLSVSFGVWCSGKSLLWWQPFLHVIAEDSADVHKDKKGTCHTKSQNWCLRWAGFHYCNSLVCEVEKQLLWIVCTVGITVNMCMTINSRQVMSSRKSALDVFMCPFSV